VLPKLAKVELNERVKRKQLAMLEKQRQAAIRRDMGFIGYYAHPDQRRYYDTKCSWPPPHNHINSYTRSFNFLFFSSLLYASILFCPSSNVRPHQTLSLARTGKRYPPTSADQLAQLDTSSIQELLDKLMMGKASKEYEEQVVTVAHEEKEEADEDAIVDEYKKVSHPNISFQYKNPLPFTANIRQRRNFF